MPKPLLAALAALLTAAFPAPTASSPDLTALSPAGAPSRAAAGAAATTDPAASPARTLTISAAVSLPTSPSSDLASGTTAQPRVPAAGWDRPLPGHPPVLRRFDPPADPYGPGHRGVDLGASPGDPVLAAGPGTVTYAGVLAGRGVVTVTHAGGLRTTYEPVVVAVRRGTTVARGTVLGRLAAGHRDCPWPACLHWGLLRGDTYLDPLTLLRRGPVRLLPLDP